MQWLGITVHAWTSLYWDCCNPWAERGGGTKERSVCFVGFSGITGARDVSSSLLFEQWVHIFLRFVFFYIARIKRNGQENMTPNHKGIAVCGKVQTQNEIVFLQNSFFHGSFPCHHGEEWWKKLYTRKGTFKDSQELLIGCCCFTFSELLLHQSGWWR